jgi:hypothetical protein
MERMSTSPRAQKNNQSERQKLHGTGQVPRNEESFPHNCCPIGQRREIFAVEWQWNSQHKQKHRVVLNHYHMTNNIDWVDQGDHHWPNKTFALQTIALMPQLYNAQKVVFLEEKGAVYSIFQP